jgi:RNA polymerase sigma factor (sigma-70 family)
MDGEAKPIAAVGGSDVSRREAFLRLFSEYGAAMRRLAAVYVNDTRDREDLVQEIAAALWQAIPKFRGEASERTWLYRIAHNTAITASAKLWRRGKKESALEDFPELRNEGSDSAADSAAVRTKSETDSGAVAVSAIRSRDAHGDERLIEAQRREWLMRAIRELAAVDRQIVTLHLEELSYREIQEITGMTEGAIATRLSRIRERLAEQIRKQEVELR